MTSSDGASAVFQPGEATAPLDPANPIMLGRWRAVTIQNGLSWTWIVQNGTDGRYVDQGKAEDEGSCTFAQGHVRCVSTMTGQSRAGAYRVDDQALTETLDESAPVVWRRQRSAAE